MLNVYDFDDVKPIDADDIIDVSAFDFTDDETWLHISTNCPPEGIAQNVPNWLKNRPDLNFEDSEGLNGARRSIDTRTFTRPKKRNNRLSFESIMEALSPPSPNVWKKQSPLSMQSNDSSQVNIETSPANSRRESVPAMLRPMKSGMLGASGQESMEAFLNLSQSKGIDSFINLTEPEFADTLMNVSQPSELSSSLVDSTKDSFMHEESIVDSQILTDSMMKTSMFGDVSDIKDFSDETFLKDIENETTLKKSNAFDDYTFTANPQVSDKGNLNSTFNTFTRRSATALPRHSLPLDVEKQTINTTFIASPYDNKQDLDETLTKTKRKDSKLSNGFNGTFMSQKQTLETINVTLDLNNDPSKHLSNEDPDADIGSDFSSGDACCNTTVSHGTMNSTFNGPTDLRRELLEQVQRSTEQNLDSTYSHASEDRCADVPVVNHNNTYRKNSSKFHEKTEIKAAIVDPPPPRQMNDKKYYTFTKKTNMTEPKTNVETKSSLESLDNTFCKPVINYKKKLQAPRVLSKVPQLFQKSNPNLASNSLKNFDNHRRSNIPNSKYGRGYQPDIPRNVEGSLINKLLPLGRFKSGSEQRLLEVGGSIKEFRSKGACGSTESIESTQSAHSAHSAHSAPDLDDRLSVCSDSSHTSYNSRVINSAQLHYIARLQEESLKQVSTPKPNRRVLENNWVDAEKDLPSPILKGGPQEIETVNHALKTSSPLLSPVGSSAQSLGSGHHINNEPSDTTYRSQNNVPRKPEMLVRPMKHSGLENKTRLRAPTNWSATNRGVGSGIPRPASRIPGPRLSRPSNGNNQTDWKKGCL